MKTIRCDKCGVEILENEEESFKWGSVRICGLEFDLCPKHYEEYYEFKRVLEVGTDKQAEAWLKGELIGQEQKAL